MKRKYLLYECAAIPLYVHCCVKCTFPKYIDKMTMDLSRQSVGYSKEMLGIVKERN